MSFYFEIILERVFVLNVCTVEIRMMSSVCQSMIKIYENSCQTNPYTAKKNLKGWLSKAKEQKQKHQNAQTKIKKLQQQPRETPLNVEKSS